MPHFGGLCAVFSVENPLILRDFHAVRTPIVWHILGAYSAEVGGGGGQNCLQPDLAGFLHSL